MTRSGMNLLVVALAGCLGCTAASEQEAGGGGGGGGGKADDSASPYSCEAPANPERGFPVDIAVTVSQGSQGSMRLKVGVQSLDVGPVTTVAMTAEDPAFALTLGLFAEADVSGLTDPDAVDRIVVYQVTGTAEYGVYRFFTNDQQVGGSFLTEGQGTRCLDSSAQSAAIRSYVEDQVASGGGFDAFATEVVRADVPVATRPAFDAAWMRMQTKISADQATPIGYWFSVPNAATYYMVVIWDPNTFGAHLEILDAGGLVATGEMADDGTFEWK